MEARSPRQEATIAATALVGLLGGEVRSANTGRDARPGYRIHYRRGYRKVRLERIRPDSVGRADPWCDPVSEYMTVPRFRDWCIEQVTALTAALQEERRKR